MKKILQRAKRIGKELFAVLSLALVLLGLALFLVTLTGCAGRRPRVYNDTCDLCITVKRPPVRPRRPLPKPTRPFYIMSFDRPNPDCIELEHKPDTAIRLWACPADPTVLR
jgi:hypothetical protein